MQHEQILRTAQPVRATSTEKLGHLFHHTVKLELLSHLS